MFRIRLDPFHFGNLDPDPFHETVPDSKKFVKIIENFHKNQPKSQEYYIFFSKILDVCLTDINIYLINNKSSHFWKKYIFDRKKVKRNKISCIYLIKVGAGAGSGSVIPRNASEDPEPDQNKTDPKHCFFQNWNNQQKNRIEIMDWPRSIEITKMTIDLFVRNKELESWTVHYI